MSFFQAALTRVCVARLCIYRSTKGCDADPWQPDEPDREPVLLPAWHDPRGERAEHPASLAHL